MNCPICGSSPISNWIFECRTVAVSRTSDYHVTAECIKIANSKLLHVASERDSLKQNRDEWRNLAKMLAQLQFDEFHAGGEALIDQHNAARELYESLSEVER